MVYYIGVDVGTSSVRAGLLKIEGSHLDVVNVAVREISIWNETADHYEQSSDEIWKSVGECVNELMTSGNVEIDSVKGIGFDGTCSLVVLNESHKPVSASLSGEPERNIVMWMDHRAITEAEYINAIGHRLLRYVGGKVSIEMQMPKIMWLKKNLQDTWRDIGALMDLPDYLTFRATGHKSRSMCSLVAKWMYDGSFGNLQEHGWDDDLLAALGLEDLIPNNHSIIGDNCVLLPGQPINGGLCEEASQQLGLPVGLPVGASLIDAYAGACGMLACKSSCLDITGKLGLICGTSTCHMIINRAPLFTPGVWGPYFSALLPGFWLNEGGQSATGKVVDHVIATHPAFNQLQQITGDSKIDYQYLSARAYQLAEEQGIPIYQLSKDLHVFTDFHGNRSPLADPLMRGMICGLNLNADLDELVKLYISTLQGIVLGTRHIISEMTKHGHNISEILMCGGLAKDPLFVQMTADVLNLNVVTPKIPESMLVGAALLGFSAERNISLDMALNCVEGEVTIYKPELDAAAYYNKKYQVYTSMVASQLLFRQIMSQ